jgi:integrase
MSTTRLFRSGLAPVLTRYLALKEALGRHYAVERDVLRHLDAFLAHADADLTVEHFAAWVQTLAHLTSGVRRNRMRIARNACLYRRRTDPDCFVPDPAQFPTPHQPIAPYVFTHEEIRRLLREVDRLESPRDGDARRATYRVAIVLLYTAGLRRGELMRLTVGDYDAVAQTLHIRTSKFHKSRVLPLSADAVQVLMTYLADRRAHDLPVAGEARLICHPHRGRSGYTHGGFAQGLRRLLRATGIRTSAGKAPRVHDLRHTFAVHALLRWYRAGAAVQAKLPFLAAYMGHVSVASTQHYLHFVEAIAGVASDRFAQQYAPLLQSGRSADGGEQ